MIHIASQSKYIDILNMLIALKADINIKNNLNETPLHFAVRSKNIDNIDSLLSQGADPSLKTIYDETPMFYAMKTGSLSVINILYNNNSPLLGSDTSGNNLLHYCVKNCPSFEEKPDDNSGDITDKLNQSNKRDIIKFLIDRGIDTEQLNNDGVSPLELTQKLINREINKQCAAGIEKDNQQINELFFDIKPIREEFIPKQDTNPTNPINPNKYGARNINKELSKYSTEHKHLLEIQTLLFNNVIKNNPKKYGEYISVDDIPKGSPIEVLDTVCVGNGMTGNEDSEECVEKGGEIVKIQNKTTKIKLELIPEDNIIIDQVKQNDLYLKKIPNKIPKGTIPSNVKNYNNSYNNQIPQTTGITYNIGSTSTNILDSLENSLGFNPQPTVSTIPMPLTKHSTMRDSDLSDSQSLTPSYTEHPSLFDDADDIVHKCKIDAIRNSTNLLDVIRKSTNLQTPEITESQTTQSILPTLEQSSNPSKSFFDKYKTIIIIFGVIILLLIIGVIVYYFYSPEQELVSI